MGAVVGIDLGTTNTVVAAIRDGHPVALPDESGSTLIPSIVSFLPSGAVLVGNAAKERRSQDSRNTIYSVKRLIGRTWDSAEVEKAQQRFPFEMREGPGRATFVLARGETYTLPEISAFVLRKAKSIAELELGEAVDRAVITVPANFNDLQRAATKVAGRVAGLEVLRILNEPTAAALAFGHTRGNRERIAVFDFGGGTFDLTLLLLTDDVFEVLATAGDTFLGGDDIDATIVERMMQRLDPSALADPKSNSDTIERLREAAEQVKLNLSDAPDTRIFLADHEIASSTSLEFTMTRDDLDAIVDPIVARTFKVCHDALSMAKLSPRDIDHVLLVGGTTRIPLVKRRVEEYFGKRARADLDPHEVVALGAAQQAMALTQVRATASGIPVPPPARPAQSSNTNEAGLAAKLRKQTDPGVGDAGLFDEPNAQAAKLRKQTDPGVGDGDAIAAARVSVVPPEVPLSHPAPTTQNFGSRSRRTTGIGLGPVDADVPRVDDDLPAVVATPTSPIRNELATATEPPSTITGLGPKQDGHAPKPLPQPRVATGTARIEGDREFARTPAVRVARGADATADLTSTLASAIVQPGQASKDLEPPSTTPQFPPIAGVKPEHQDLPERKAAARLGRASATTGDANDGSAPATDPQFRGVLGDIASPKDPPAPSTDPLFGKALHARAAIEDPGAPSTSPLFGAIVQPGPAKPGVPPKPVAATPNFGQVPSARDTIADDTSSWDHPAFEAGAIVGLPIVSGQTRSPGERQVTKVSVESEVSAAAKRTLATANTVDLLADLPLVVGPSTAGKPAAPLQHDEQPRTRTPATAATYASAGVARPQPMASVDVPPSHLGLPDPDMTAELEDFDDAGADEPTMIRRPAQSSQDLSGDHLRETSPEFDDLPEIPAHYPSEPGRSRADTSEDLPAVLADTRPPPSSSRGLPRRSGRPSSLNEDEIRARYGNLPLIVGGRRVGPSVPATSAEPVARAAPRQPDIGANGLDQRGNSAFSEAPPAVEIEHRAGPSAAVTGRSSTIGSVTKRPNPLPAANVLPPLPSPPSAVPIPLLEPEEVEPSEIILGPATPPLKRPIPPERTLPLAGSAEEFAPQNVRLRSNRPAAKQGVIEELELPIPDLPPMQSLPGPDRSEFMPPGSPARPATIPSPTAPRVAPATPEKPAGRAEAPKPLASELRTGVGLAATLPLGATGLPTGPWQPPGGTAAPQKTAEPQAAPLSASRGVDVPPLLPSIPRQIAARPTLLIDVTPLSLCVETVGGYVDVLISRNTPVPCERTREFITAHDNQQTVVVRVAQGESKNFPENVLLGEVQLAGIPAAPRGQLRIAVTFGIDSDGILHVRALEVGSGQSALADLKLSGAPSPPEVAQMMARLAAKGQA